jgi:cell division protein FtsN
MAKDYRVSKSRPRKSKKSRPYIWIFSAFLAGYIATSILNPTKIRELVSAPVDTAPAKQIVSSQTKVEKAQLPKPKLEFYTLLTSDRAVKAQEISEEKVQSVNQRETDHFAQNGDNPVEASTKNTFANFKAASPITPTNLTTHAAQDVEQKSKALVSGPEVKTAKPSAPTSKESFLLQVAAFKTKPEADRMKATLILKGYNANLTAIYQQNTTWYRVIIGPFANRQLAQKAQITIARSERVTGMIRKV